MNLGRVLGVGAVALAAATACTERWELLWRRDAGAPELPPVSTFNAGVAARGFDGPVYGLAVDGPTQRVYAVGAFTSYGADPVSRVARLLPTGELDPTFATGAGFDAEARVVTLDSDGRPVIGGRFSSFDGHARVRLARLTLDGALDDTFRPPALDDEPTQLVWDGARGHLLVAGYFSTVGARSQGGLARLLADGGIDPAFAIGAGFLDPVYGIALDPATGQLYSAGWPGFFGGTWVGVLRRHRADGSLDPTFVAALEDRNDARQVVRAPTGEVFVSGEFLAASGVTVLFARLQDDGALAPGYVPAAVDFDNIVHVMLLGARGTTLWLGGDFTLYGTTPADRLIALELDGTVSPSAAGAPGPPGTVRALAEGSGRLYVGGPFGADGGLPAYLLAVGLPGP